MVEVPAPSREAEDEPLAHAVTRLTAALESERSLRTRADDARWAAESDAKTGAADVARLTAERRQPAGRHAPMRRRWWDRWFVQAPLCYAAYNLFEWARSQIEGSKKESLANALDVIHAERVLHIFREARVEHWLLPCAPACDPATTPDVESYAMRFWNIYYGLLHFAVPALVLIFLYRRHFERYRLWRNTAGFMLLISLLGFWLYPVLPPRLLPTHYGFFDASHFGGIGPIGKAEAGPMANAFAAMPSLHIGWSTWCACAAVPVVRRRWVKVLLILHPIATMFAVVVTANHYILDGVGGLACLGLGYLVARLVTRPRTTDETVEASAADLPPPDRTTTGLRAP